MSETRIIQADNRGRILLRPLGVEPLGWYQATETPNGWLVLPVKMSVPNTDE